MFDTARLQAAFDSGLTFDRYVATGSPDQQAGWLRIHAQVTLTPAQRSLVAGFTRRMNVLVVSGIWCGDCVQQCPLLARVAEANPERIDLRFVERDVQLDLAQQLRINGGDRVPVVLFLAEDYELVSVYGDRTLSRYRALAARQLGPACPLPGAPVATEELAATLQDWLNEFERVQLLLRLSGRLRQKHGD